MKQVKIGFSRKIKYITVILILATVLLVGLGIYLDKKTSLNSPTKTVPSESWFQFTSEVGNYKILFPEPNPQKTSDIYIPIENIKGSRHAIVYCDKSEIYCIEAGIYPSFYNLRGDINNLNLYKNIILQNFENPKLINSSSDKFLGNPYIDFVFTSSNQFYKYRIFAIEDNTYALSMSSTDSKFNSFNKFVNSFSVINYKNNNLTWKPLISKKWNFKTIFPNDNFTTEVNGPNSESLEGITYFSKPNTQTTYVITIQKYKSEKNLRSLLNYTLEYVKSNSSINFKLISSKDSTCSNKPCLIFLAQQNDQEGFSYYKGEAIAADNNTTYFIFGVVNNESYFSNIDKIINSFSLISK